ncbi:phosphatase PAP2 family protein [Pseudactinotalea sp. Z1748]|uniref:phosphatase PAP2 family protein n=1 Tax=Pseudactinotalea sp. Z1748 TaxID=3413027 RepID=UPI003C7CA2A1
MVDEGRHAARVQPFGTRFRYWAALLSILFAAALLGLYTVAVRTHTGQVVDVTVYRWSHGLNHGGGLSGALRSNLHVPLLAACLVLVALALGARDWHRVAAALTVAAATPVASLWLRDEVFDRPYLGDHAFVMNTLPSGHVSLSAALAVAIMILWPSRARWPIVVAGVLLATASLASVVAHAHRPSDVVASVLLTGAVTCAALALGGPLAAPRVMRKAVVVPSTESTPPPFSSSSADWFRRGDSGPSTGQRRRQRPARLSPDQSGTRQSRHQ